MYLANRQNFSKTSFNNIKLNILKLQKLDLKASKIKV